eukprot:GHVS01031590.1.p1 GENE.GHVS01031590.1~~GHVS01031590.1.p1  ORF type:complete len:253 (+),score=49.66 GHVS01031590.1:111-869(+)
MCWRNRDCVSRALSLLSPLLPSARQNHVGLAAALRASAVLFEQTREEGREEIVRWRKFQRSLCDKWYLKGKAIPNSAMENNERIITNHPNKEEGTETSHLPNPYLRIFYLFMSLDYLHPAPVRSFLSEIFSFSVPSTPALLSLSSLHPSILELGAASGYWASQANKFGADVLAVDNFSERNNHGWGVLFGLFGRVEKAEGEQLLKKTSERRRQLLWATKRDTRQGGGGDNSSTPQPNHMDANNFSPLLPFPS